jgi:hypothetical protein
MATERKGFFEMLAEFFREVAVLVLVFYPIEVGRSGSGIHLGIRGILITSLVFLVLGMLTEKWR